MKETKDWVEVRIPTEIRTLIPDMPTRMRLELSRFVTITNETPPFVGLAPLRTPPGYVRKMKEYWNFLDGAKQNKMTNLQTFRENRSGRTIDMVRGGNVRDVTFENMGWGQYHLPDYMEDEKRILRDGLLYVSIRGDTLDEIEVKNKYFESGRGIEVAVGSRGTLYGTLMSVNINIVSKKQPRPEPRAPSTRPRKRRRNV